MISDTNHHRIVQLLGTGLAPAPLAHPLSTCWAPTRAAQSACPPWSRRAVLVVLMAFGRPLCSRAPPQLKSPAEPCSEPGPDSPTAALPREIQFFILSMLRKGELGHRPRRL